MELKIRVIKKDSPSYPFLLLIAFGGFTGGIGTFAVEGGNANPLWFGFCGGTIRGFCECIRECLGKLGLSPIKLCPFDFF